MAGADAQDSSLFVARVRELITRPPVTCVPDLPARDIARQLSREGVGSVIVCDAEGAPIGIVTDRDLRRKVVAEGCDYATTTARAIMSAPLVTVSPDAFAFEAILEMTRRAIHHIVVTSDGRLVGVVSTYDLLRLQAAHPVTLARDIGHAGSLESLKDLAGRMTPLVRQLFDAGGSAYDIGNMVAELNDRIVTRVLALAAVSLDLEGLSPPSIPWCWLALGSEVRREQTLRTDQDNGLVYADPATDDAEQAAAYYARLAGAATRGLVSVGFPECPAGLMASNPAWCRPVSVWSGYFLRWMTEAWPAQAAAAITLFDLRPVTGDSTLAERLQSVIRQEAPGRRSFLGVMAREAVSSDTALTLWNRIAVERRGPHRGAIDIKRAGAQQLAGAGRVHALEFGLNELHTLDRLTAAARLGVYTEGEARDIRGAYECLAHLRIGRQLACLAAGQEPDNWIDPRQMTRTERTLLRETLRTVDHVRVRTHRRYGVGSLPGL